MKRLLSFGSVTAEPGPEPRLVLTSRLARRASVASLDKGGGDVRVSQGAMRAISRCVGGPERWMLAPVLTKDDKSSDCTDELENPPEFNRLMTLALIATGFVPSPAPEFCNYVSILKRLEWPKMVAMALRNRIVFGGKAFWPGDNWQVI